MTLADAGFQTMTGGRIKWVRRYLGGERLCLTYGDGVGKVDIAALLRGHREQGAVATVTAGQQPRRYGYGALNLSHDQTRAAALARTPCGTDP